MFREIPDDLWDQVAPLVAPFRRKRPGGKASLPQRQVLNGILYVLITGCQWAMLPTGYGSKSAVYEHFQRWVAAGVFTQLLRSCLQYYDELKTIAWEWQAMDGCLLPAPGCGKDPAEGLGANPTDRGRGGTKLHILVDEEGTPLGLHVTGAHVHDSRLVGVTFEALIIEQPKQAETPPSHLSLDKGYDYPRVEAEVRTYDYIPHIKHRGIHEEATVLPDGTRYPARRWVVERTLAWLKAFRSLRTRYTRHLAHYQAFVYFACALLIFQRAIA